MVAEHRYMRESPKGFSSLASLLEPEGPSEKPYRRFNCLQGGAWTTRCQLRPLDCFLAAISVYSCGVKVQDDLEDEQQLRTRLAGR